MKTKNNKAALYWRKFNAKRRADAEPPLRARIARAPQIEKIDRRVIIERDRSICYLCGKRVEKKSLQIDHVQPLAKGGSHTYENLRVACARCNGRKDDLTLDEFRRRFGASAIPAPAA